MNDFNETGREYVEAQLLSLTPEAIKPQEDELSEQLSVVVKPYGQVLEKFLAFMDQLKQEFPQHLYYDKEQLHFTLLGGLSPQETGEVEIVAALQENVSKFPFKLLIKNLGASPHVISTVGYPGNDNIHELRQKLRERTGAGTDYQAIKPFWEHLTWMNFCRFQSKPDPEFLKRIIELKDVEFGSLDINRFFLYTTHSRTLKPEQSKLLQMIEI